MHTARASGRSLYQSAAAVSGKGGANLQAFNALIEAMRDATKGSTLREIIEHVLEATGLLDGPYRAQVTEFEVHLAVILILILRIMNWSHIRESATRGQSRRSP